MQIRTFQNIFQTISYHELWKHDKYSALNIIFLYP